MNPDYPTLVNDFIRPVVSFFLFAFLILGWVVAYQLMKEVTELKIKLGRESQREEFKYWFLRKSAPMVLPLLALKTLIVKKQFQSILKQLLNKKKKVLKLAFRLDSIVSIILNIFQIVPTGTNSEGSKQLQ